MSKSIESGNRSTSATSYSEELVALAHKWLPGDAEGCDDVIMLSGSAGIGIADSHSDIDLYVISDRNCALPERGQSLERLGLSKAFDAPTMRGGMLERYRYGRLFVDIEYVPRSVVLQTIESIVVRYEVDPAKQKTARGLLDAIVLNGQAEWLTWCGRLALYPRQLSVNMIRAHLRFEPLVRLKRRTLERGDPLAFTATLTNCIVHLVGVLAGLNGYYLAAAPGLLKWTDLHLSRMRICPEGIATLIRDAIREPSDENLRALEGLIAGVFDVVEKAFPDVSTRTARDYLAWH